MDVSSVVFFYLVAFSSVVNTMASQHVVKMNSGVLYTGLGWRGEAVPYFFFNETMMYK